MSHQYYDQGHAGGIPDYYTAEDPPSQRPSQSRIPRPRHGAPDRRRGQPSMRPDHAAALGRSSRRAPEANFYPEPTAWETSQSLYDGSAYGENGYGQHDPDQWPLPSYPHAQQSPRTNGSSPRKPPPRPQRPDEPPRQRDFDQHIRDPPRNTPHAVSANRQYHQPPAASHHGSGQWTGNGYAYAPPNYPPPSRPPPQPQHASSMGPQSAIPQYAPPQVPQQAVYGTANRRPPLGPPPSARRGPANYYPQMGPVHPIVEETDSMRGSARTGSVHTGGHDSKNSFASSNAIPIGISQHYMDNGLAQPNRSDIGVYTTASEDTFDESTAEHSRRRSGDRHPEMDPSREDQHSPDVLVRQASVGKKSRPTLTTVKSGEKMRKKSGAGGIAGIAGLQSQQRDHQSSGESLPTVTEHSRAIARSNLEGQASPGASHLDLREAEEEQKARNAAAVSAAAAYMAKEEPSRSHSDRHIPEEALGSRTDILDPSLSSDPEKGVESERSKELLGATMVNELHPPRSRVSLPLAPVTDPRVESILASLEKGGAISAEEAEELKQPIGGLSERAGKRRPPRLNVDVVRDAEARGSLTSLPDLIKRATKLASNLDRGKTASRLGMNWFDGANDGDEKRRSGRITDMLNQFPPPTLATPPGSRGEAGRWSSRMRHSALPSDSDAGDKKRKRTYCGMPFWLFILLLILLFLLIAAAVIVPVMLLIVIPNDSNAARPPATSSCEKKLSCENGGVNVLGESGYCECLCVKGYSGSTCETYSPQGCTTTTVGSTTDATIGESIPRILEGSKTNFSVPLDEAALVGLFSRSDLSCTAQNALVTFNEATSKRSFIDVIVRRSPTPAFARRHAAAATSDGIVYQSGTPSTSASTASSTSITATTTSSGASSTSTSIVDDSTALDFARVAVLYVFQASGAVGYASSAQENLQTYFREGKTESGQTIHPSSVSLSNGYTCDLISYSISLSNGTTVGGGSAS